ncbi:MAG TPA: sulfatase [Terriglobales bacterium]|nr:sulfatase [Terriglobales bacterium]
MRRSFALAYLLLAAAGCRFQSEPKAAAGAPNVAVILIDTLRPDHLRAYGYDRETAPFLSELAERSTVFLNAVSSSSWTAPATASLFTGLYPNRHGVIRGFFAERKRQRQEDGGAELQINRIASEAPTMAELFRSRGCRTFAIGANLNIGPEIGFDRGFDRFQRLGDLARAKRIGDDAPAADVVTQLRQWRDDLRASSPYLLYLHFNDPHGPFHKREPWYSAAPPAQNPTLAAYDSEIGYVDSFIRQVYDDLGLGDGILVVVSDHGNAFGEHGKRGHGPGAGLYGVVNRIVLMISGPKHGIAPQRVEVPVSIVDVLPTLLELAGIGSPPQLAGQSLVRLLRGGEPAGDASGERALFAHLIDYGQDGDVWAVVKTPWKLIRDPDGTVLYDLAEDPGEQSDLAAQRPDIVTALGQEIDRYLAQSQQGESIGVGISPAELERLRALGYAE